MALLGSVAVCPVIAATSSQALEQQFESEVSQGQLSQAQQDLQTMEQNSGYTQPSLSSSFTDVATALIQAIKNNDYSVASTLSNEVQVLAQQITAAFNQGQITSAQQNVLNSLQSVVSASQQDLPILEKLNGYTAPSLSDLSNALTTAVTNNDWTVANTLFAEIQTLDNDTGAVSSNTTSTPAPTPIATTTESPTTTTTAPTSVFTVGSTQYAVAGQTKTMDTRPFIKANRVYLPVRYLADALGISDSNITWNATSQTTTINDNGQIAQFQIGSNVLQVNNQNITMDVSPMLDGDNRVCLPVSWLAKAFNINISWDGSTQTVTINGSANNSVNGSSTQQGPTQVASQTPSDNKARIFGLSDDEINDAINTGQKGFEYVSNTFNPNYQLNATSNNCDIFTPDVMIMTPYFEIVRASCLAAIKYQNYTFNEGKDYANEMKSLICFDVQTYGSSIDYASSLVVVLKQGNTIIQPTDIGNSDQLAETSSSWPNPPAYEQDLTVEFPSDEIDVNQPAELIYNLDPIHIATYRIDFSQYK